VTSGSVVGIGPLPASLVEQIKADTPKMADMSANSWGYRAQLLAEGGEQAVGDFNSQLVAYLKTTALMSWASDEHK
jgi:hypothetical protein